MKYILNRSIWEIQATVEKTSRGRINIVIEFLKRLGQRVHLRSFGVLVGFHSSQSSTFLMLQYLRQLLVDTF